MGVNLPDSVTLRQAEAWRMREEGLSTADAAARLGVSQRQVHRLWEKVQNKLDHAGEYTAPTRSNKLTEDQPGNEEWAVEALVAGTDPSIDRIHSAMLEEGFKPKVVKRFLGRLRRESSRSVQQIKQVRTSDLQGLISDRAHRIVDSIDDFDIEQASLRDKATSLGILIDKRQLLSGEPTQILSSTERGQVDHLVQVVVDEAQRRGMTIDATSATPQILPAEGEDLEAGMSKFTAKAIRKQRDKTDARR